MEEQQSPGTPPLVIPSPDEQDTEENAAATAPAAPVAAPDHAQVTEAAAATPPRSEMLDLPRDFLSLRPQEPALPHRDLPQDHQAAADNHRKQQEQQPVSVSVSPAATIATTTTTPSSAKAAPLIAVHMAPSTIAPSVHKCTPAVAVYPRPLASHEEVLRDKDLFLDTLRRLHGSLGFKSLTIPTIGGTQLDLHLLYKEVTARGGLQQVIKDRIWKEIKAAFHFPPTTTNASFVLRKYYSSLLHHYEQVYFFRNQGNLVPAPGDHSAGGEMFSDDSDAIRRRRKRSYDSDSGNATNCIGQTVTGSIVGKFEHGYLVSVTVGSETLKGVLYNVPPGDYVPQLTTISTMGTTATTTTTTTTTSKLPNGTQQQALADNGGNVELRHKKRRRLGLRKKDPNAPKLNRSAYNFFFAEQRARIRLLQPNREISRMIGDSWSKLTDEQRLPYKQRGLVDKERYRKEITQYREKMNVQRGAKDPDVESDLQAVHDEEVSDDGVHEHDENENGVEHVDTAGTAVSAPQASEQQETLEFKSILSNQA